MRGIDWIKVYNDVLKKLRLAIVRELKWNLMEEDKEISRSGKPINAVISV